MVSTCVPLQTVVIIVAIGMIVLELYAQGILVSAITSTLHHCGVSFTYNKAFGAPLSHKFVIKIFILGMAAYSI